MNSTKTEQLLFKFKRTLKTADLALSLSLEAIRGETGAFDARLHEEGRPYPGQISSAANVRTLLRGSSCVTDKGRLAYGGDHGARVQDAISFRAAAQTHGGAWDMASRLLEVTKRKEKNQTLLELSMDTANIALADLGTISERRSFRLNDSVLSMGLPMNLAAGESGFNHGFPVLQAVASALVADMKRLAVPCSALGISGDEALKLSTDRFKETLELMDGVLAVEIMMAAQGIDLVLLKAPDLILGTGTGTALKSIRQEVPFAESDHFFRKDLEATNVMVETGKLLKEVEIVTGELSEGGEMI